MRSYIIAFIIYYFSAFPVHASEPGDTDRISLSNYGVFSHKDGPSPEVICFASLVTIRKDMIAADQDTVTLALDDASLAMAGNLVYRFTYGVYDVEQTTLRDLGNWLFGPGNPRYLYGDTIESASNTITLPAVPEDREIALAAEAFLHTGEMLEGLPVVVAGQIYTVVFDTPKTTPWYQQLYDAMKLLKDMAARFAEKGTAVLSAIGNDPTGYFNRLFHGLTTGVSNFIGDLTNPETLKAAALKWLSSANNITLPNTWNSEAVTSFLLQYAGLTFDRVKSVLIEALGAGNAAAISQVAS